MSRQEVCENGCYGRVFSNAKKMNDYECPECKATSRAVRAGVRTMCAQCNKLDIDGYLPCRTCYNMICASKACREHMKNDQCCHCYIQSQKADGLSEALENRHIAVQH